MGGGQVTFGTGDVGGRPAFGANFPGVACFFDFGPAPAGLNHFQVLLIDRSDVAAGDFDIEFNYDQIVWEAGLDSGGDSNCLGGSPARAGFANGSGTFQELAGSGVVSGFLDSNLTTGLVNTSLNNSQLGRHIIPVRGGTPSLEVVEADLSVTKTDSPDPVLLGSDITYTVVVSNSGPSTGSQVTLTDTLPGGVSFVSSAASPGTCSGTSTVTCTLGSLASGDSATVTIVVTPNSAGDLTNTASVTATESDSSTGDNTASETTTVNPAANLSLAKTASPNPVLLGEELTYTLTVNNSGPSAGTAVTVTDTLPVGVSFVSSAASPGTCSGTSTVTCTLGSLASGDSATVTIVVTPNSTGELTNTASVTATESDPSAGDNTAPDTTTVDPAANLSLTKTAFPNPVLLGEELTYTVTVNNSGPSAGTAVTVTDTLPVGVSFVSSAASPGTCSGTSTVICTLGSLASGDSATVTIVVVPTATGDLTNTAVASADEGDPSTGDNTAPSTTTVNPAANLSLTKTASPNPVLLEEELTYTITVTNSGPSAGTGVTVTDTLPVGVSFVSSSASPGTCSGTSTVTCTLGSLASGDSATVTIVVTPNSTGELTNTASVIATESDPSTGDNTAPDTTTVIPAANLSLTNTGPPTLVGLGIYLTYTLVVSNGGPSTASKVTLTDSLPGGVSFVSSSNSQGTCSGTSIVTCTLGSLASGDSATVTIVVAPNSPGDLTNTASVTTPESDPSTGDNTATAISTDPASPPSVEIVEVPSMTQWGLVGMAVTFAVLILLGLGFRSRLRPSVGRPL